MSHHHRHHLSKRDKPKNRSQTIFRLWKELIHEKGFLIFVFFIVFINASLAVLGPFLIGFIIDNYIIKEKVDGLSYVLIVLILVYLFYSLTTFLQNYWMIGIAQRTVYSLRTRLFSHLEQLSIAFFDKRQHGELMSRLTNDLDNVSSTLNSSVIQIFSSVLTLIGTITVMIYLSPILTMITFLIVPLMVYGMKWITSRTGRLFKEQQRYLGELNGFIEETISGQKIIKAFSQEKVVMDSFLEKSENLKKAAYYAQTYSGFIPKLMNVLNNLSFALIALIGGILAFNGYVTIGVMVTFTEYARQFTRPLNDLANQFNTLLSAIAGAERVFEILDTKSEEKEEGKLLEISSLKGDVKFSHVSFSYEKEGSTICDVNFHVSAGSTVALVGPTGAGKTTIIQLLTRFYDPDEGTIEIDGIDSKKIKRKSLREHFGFVLQDVFLFEGTIMDNIRYGRLDATDEEVIEAAKKANAHSFISKLENGYHTVLQQDGSGISQGQKQLLAIARAILRNPAILLLDEATSTIDTVTEIKIQEALNELMKGRTTFVIAHRLNTIRHADLILVLDKGRIIERGTHQQLIEQKGFYYQLHQQKAFSPVG